MSETIAAIATAPGGGIGVIRLSGPLARKLATRATRKNHPPHAQLRRRRVYAETGELLDDGMLVVFQGPHSFTGDDVVEFHGHGGAQTLGAVLDAFLALGARLALPGEFSERAYLAGKIDLTQAEAIADLVAARTDDARRAALRMLSGGLRDAANSVGKSLKTALAHIEATIDFPEEVGELDTLAVRSSLAEAHARLTALLGAARRGRAQNEGITLALIGRPNVGKSSLLNALVGSERAIVTDQPGTTRDIVGETVLLGGFPVRALDTAGLRETDDPIEKEGVARARSAAESADLVLVVTDATRPLTPDEQELLAAYEGRALLVRNKADLCPRGEWGVGSGEWVSAKNKAGLDALGVAVAQLLSGESESAPLVTRTRHEDALRRAQISVEAAQASLSSGQPPELIAVDCHGALQSLGELTGEVSRSEIIEGIFRTFCLGK